MSKDVKVCVRCGLKAIGETIAGRPACYYHEDKFSYLERMEKEKVARQRGGKKA